MTTTEHGDPDEVTQSMVRLLWDQALDTPRETESIHNRAEALLDRANSEDPVVNWGLTELHALTRTPGRPVGEMREHLCAWLTEVERYEADPQGWMRHYFQTMVRDFAGRHGPERAAHLASQLVRRGLLAQGEVPGETSEIGS